MTEPPLAPADGPTFPLGRRTTLTIDTTLGSITYLDRLTADAASFGLANQDPPVEIRLEVGGAVTVAGYAITLVALAADEAELVVVDPAGVRLGF